MTMMRAPTPRSSTGAPTVAVAVAIAAAATVLAVAAGADPPPSVPPPPPPPPLPLSPAQPSFLFLLIDDVGYSDLGYAGGTASTPNIDSWSRRHGTLVLRDFHSAGTVCSPTRATVLTGRNHFRDCVDYVYGCSDMRSCVPDFEFAPSRTFTVGDAARAAGPDHRGGGSYFSGKWHLGSFYNDSEALGGRTSSPSTHGFDGFRATVEVAPTSTVNCMCRPEWEGSCEFGHYGGPTHCYPPGECCFNYWTDDALSPHGVTNMTAPTPEDDASYLAGDFARFLASRRRTAGSGHLRGRVGGGVTDASSSSSSSSSPSSPPPPFLAQISFHNCHIPFIGSAEARDACSRNVTCRPPDDGDPPYTDEELDYYSCLTQLDVAVGEVLSALEREGYYDNTMVWLTSDNGPEMNCPPRGICKRAGDRPHRPAEGPGSAGPLRGRKRDIYEGGHRVPGIISWPAVIEGEGGRESWETVVTTDFLPTVMEVLGVDRPPSQQTWVMDGRSVLPILNGGRWADTGSGPRGVGLGYYDAETSLVNGWGYRYGKWKYVEGSASCKEASCRRPQLYDLEADLGERNDLSGLHPEILGDLQDRFQDWHRSVMRSREEESRCTKSKELGLPASMSEGSQAVGTAQA